MTLYNKLPHFAKLYELVEINLIDEAQLTKLMKHKGFIDELFEEHSNVYEGDLKAILYNIMMISS